MKSDYSFEVKEFAGRNCIFIVDLNKGNASVTSTIANVVKEISDAEKLDPEQCLIVYQDSDGKWDGWAADRGIIGLQADNQYHAINRLKKKF